MKSILAAIRSVLRALASFVTVMVRVGDKLVAMVIRRPLAPEPIEAMEAAQATAMAPVETMTNLRNAANALAAGGTLTPAMANSVQPLQVQWLQAMTRVELCKVIVARDEAIRLHLKGIAPLKGVVPYHADAIRDVAAARAKRPAPFPARRTLRAVLADRNEAMAA